MNPTASDTSAPASTDGPPIYFEENFSDVYDANFREYHHPYRTVVWANHPDYGSGYGNVESLEFGHSLHSKRHWLRERAQASQCYHIISQLVTLDGDTIKPPPSFAPKIERDENGALVSRDVSIPSELLDHDLLTFYIENPGFSLDDTTRTYDENNIGRLDFDVKETAIQFEGIKDAETDGKPGVRKIFVRGTRFFSNVPLKKNGKNFINDIRRDYEAQQASLKAVSTKEETRSGDGPSTASTTAAE